MPDVTFNVALSADDGHAKIDGTLWSSTGNSVTFGKFSTSIQYHAFFRFSGVTIPSGATINTAVVRFTANTSNSENTCNVNLHFEAADDPAAPTTGADLIGRSLGSALAWSSIGAWTAGNTFDTPELNTELQAIIDRGGWNSGQAVTLHVVDNGSSNNARRNPAGYDDPIYTEAQLIVSYSIPYQIEIDETIELTESVTALKDTETFSISELLSISEFVSVQRDLQVDVADDLTISEFIQVIPTFSGELTETQNIEVSEYVELLRGFSGEIIQLDILTLTESVTVSLPPQIVSFESITVIDTGNIRPEPFTSDDLNLSEYVLARRGYWEDVDDSFTIADKIDVFHYTNWLRQNAARANQRFFFTLTGATDSVSDTEIPASSIFARKRSGDPTYLQVTVPTFNYATEISLRTGGEMLVDMGYEIDGEIGLRERILEADLEDISTYEGPVNRSVVLTGHRTQDFGGQVVTFNASEVIYRAYQTRARVFRFAFIDPFLNPGDTVVVGNESFTCNNIVYIINALRTTMEVREAL
jgi:hypothetical protein